MMAAFGSHAARLKPNSAARGRPRSPREALAEVSRLQNLQEEDGALMATPLATVIPALLAGTSMISIGAKESHGRVCPHAPYFLPEPMAGSATGLNPPPPLQI